MRTSVSVGRSAILALLVAVLATAGACGSKSTTGGGGDTTPKPEKSLYDRLGGQPAIEAVIDDFLANVLADARINSRFAGADAAHLRQMLIDQVCEASGGPCKYTGKPMPEAHAGMGITDEEFGALVEDLTKSLTKFNVGEKEQADLLGALGGMKDQIVGK